MRDTGTTGGAESARATYTPARRERRMRAGASPAVVCYAAAISLGLIVGLGKRGIVVPDDITVTSDLGVVEALELRDAPTLDVEGAALGDRAMERLLRAIEGGDPEPRQETLPVRVTWSRA